MRSEGPGRRCGDAAGVRQREDLDRFRKSVPNVPLLVIAGHDDISVKEYADLGYQLIIYATALINTYTHLKETGTFGIEAPEVARRRNKIEELISLPEYYQVEAETTKKEFQELPGTH